MLYTIVVLLCGVYIGQEYDVPNINSFVKNSIKHYEFKDKKPSGIFDFLKKFIN